MGKRLGFTLVELLVVIAIIGILVALLLPAVQSARESGRRAKCLNNMKQIMLSFHMHHDARNGLPPCRVTTTGMQHGWMIDLLPYIEQQARYDNYSLNNNFFDGVNAPVVDSYWETPVCASAPAQKRRFQLGLNGTMYGTFSFAGDYYVNHLLSQSTATAAGLTCNPCRPVLFVQENEENQLHPMSRITDGTSNTVLLVEQAGRPDYYVKKKKQSSNASLVQPNWWGSWPSYQHFTYQGYSADGTTMGTACSVNCNNGQGIYAFHSGGANVTRVDGSASFVQENISVAVMMQLLTRDGGETVAE